MLEHSAVGAISRPFAGRTHELEVLARRLQAPVAERAGVVLVGGEPGVGKSRLLSEAAALAEAHGWRVFVGHAFDTEGMPPYLPFIEALQGLRARLPSGDAAGATWRRRPGVGVVAAGVPRRLPDLPSPAEMEPQSRRYRLFEAMAALLDAVAMDAESGLLLCLEDLQWADDSTLRLF